ncbi:N-acetylglucosaminyl-phosphatidylinositol biosynthetic protein [Alternaria alternata]|nr:N-acetylglucosaminyl-phosphatidylinositol biosynthetic protein [Alternaria alternata]
MVTHNGLMRVFWPSDAPRDSAPGVLVGFRNSKSDVFVVGVLQDVELRQVENALLVGTLLRHSPHDIQELLQRCGHSSVRALGSVNPKTPADQSGADLLTVHTDPSLRFPRLHHPDDALITMQVIVYDRPHPTRMQYLSLKPITLALGDKTKVAEWDVAFEELERAEERERKRKAHLVEKLKLHRVIAHPRTQKELALPMIIEQVNCSYELNALLQKNIGMIGRRMKRALSVSERVVESANDLWDYIWLVLHYAFRVWIWPIAAQLFIFGLITHRIMGEAVLQVLHWRPGSSDSPALKDISATAQQIDIRLQQSCYWPIQYLTLRRRKINWESITSSHPEYIRFYNSLWLVANDVIMGIAVGTFIIENASFVAAQVDTIFSTWSVDGLRRMISWLMGWPGGLKLNTELAAFLGDLFLWVIDYWAGCISLLRPNLPALVQIIGFSAFAGATMPISIFSDLVSLLTLHIYSFYVASARIFHWQLTIIISLFHLFRGKKRNILRNRIDSCDYDLDQLLLGTILFTLQFFLLPTVFVFYLTFASARIAVIGLKAALEMGLACLNHFPLFAVMLRLKDPGRLPGGIYFELQNTTDASSNTAGSVNSPPTAYVLLKVCRFSRRSPPAPTKDKESVMVDRVPLLVLETPQLAAVRRCCVIRNLDEAERPCQGLYPIAGSFATPPDIAKWNASSKKLLTMATKDAVQTSQVGRMKFDPSSFLLVRVGCDSSQQEFLLHEGILCARSEFFRRALNGNWIEKKERLVKLPEDDPQTFAFYVSFIYTNVVSDATALQTMTPDGFQAHILAVVKLYVLAEKLQDRQAKNEALRTVLSDTAERSFADSLPNAEIVQFMYNNTLQGSLGRRLMVDLWNDVHATSIIKQREGICKEFFVDLAHALLGERPSRKRNGALLYGAEEYCEEL